MVIPAYRAAPRFPCMPVLGPRSALVNYRLMAAYNRRFRLAFLRRERGEAGRRNDGRRVTAMFNLRWAPYRMFARGLRLWLTAEVDALRLRAAAWVRGRPRVAIGTGFAVLLLAGCAGSSPERPVGAAPDLPAGSRQTVDELRREVAQLRAELEAHRRTAALARDFLGLREELEAVQTAIQAVIRDLEQRQLEGSQTVDRRLAVLAGRVDDLAARVRRAEAAMGEPAPRGSGASVALPPAPPPAASAPSASAPAPEAPAKEPGAASAPAPPGRVSRLQRVRATEAAGETRVTVEADGMLAPRAFTLADPARLVVDLENAAFGFDRTPLGVDGPIVERIRFIQLRSGPTPAIRLIVTLKRSVPYWVEPQERGVILHLGRSAPAR